MNIYSNLNEYIFKFAFLGGKMRYQKPDKHYKELKRIKAIWSDENFFKKNEKKMNLSKNLSDRFNFLLSQARFMRYEKRYPYEVAVKKSYLACREALTGFEMKQKIKSRNKKGAKYVV